MSMRFDFIIAVAVLVSVSVHAATVTVSTGLDELDGNTSSIGNLIATPGGSGISLREAIVAANNTGGADTILFSAALNGTPITLTRVNAGGLNEDACSTGDLDVTDSLTITGNGIGNTFVQSGTTTANGIDKVFAINPICDHAVNFTLSGVTVRFGRNAQPYGAADFSFTGGGLDYCGSGSGTCSISNCAFTDNTNVNGYGGGMNIDEVAPAATTITIANTVFARNTSRAWGGGLNVYGDNARTTISGSTFSSNQTLGTGGFGAQGGGINIRVTNQNDGDGAPTPFVNISNSTIMNNVGVGSGGGIDIAGSGNQDVTISNTAITGNSLIVVALGVSNTIGGGIDHANNTARTTILENVLIANNLSEGSATSNGGGISHVGGNLVIRNSTITGNRTRVDGGGVYVVTDPPSLTLINTTIANNRSDTDNNASGAGGGILKLAGSSAVTLQNSLVDGNFKGTGSTEDEVNGTVTATFSLLGNTTGATLTGGSANNQLNLSGRLAPLANNGGQTVGPAGFTAVLQTHALLAGSPALDNGSNALAPGGISTDQRGAGFARILDAADADTTDEVDLGAYEAHPSVEDMADQSTNEDIALPGVTVNIGDADLVFDTVTFTSSNTGLVPNGNISVAGSGSARSVSVTPSANQFGTTTITATVSDTVAGTAQSMTDTFVLTVNPVADTPSVTDATTSEDTQTSSGLVISRNVADGAEVTHFKITGITGGTLFKNNGTTPISNNGFITFAEGNAGLRFTPTANLSTPGNSFSFNVQASPSAVDAGLGGNTVTATITVSPVADTPSVTNASTSEDTQTSSGLVISRNVADGAEVTHFKITGISNGTLFKNDGTTQINNNDFVTFAEGNAGLKFTPNPNSFANGSFTLQASLSAVDAGLGGNTVTATITVNPVADTPSVTPATTFEGQQTTSGLVISRNAADGAEVTHFKITGISHGSLFQNDGTTQINDNDFITFAEANAGLRFTPAAGLYSPGHSFSFGVQASGSGLDAGLGGNVAAATITVNPHFDFGDAPDPLVTTGGKYPTLVANNGARHVVLNSGATLYLGAVAPDVESNGQPNASATGDQNGTDDEEGVVLPATFERNVATTISVNVTGTGGKLNAWIDWNSDGDWDDPGEQIATDQPFGPGVNILNLTPPSATVSGTSFARFRLSSETGLAQTGQAGDGEVEDYAVTLLANTIPVASANSYTVAEGGTLTASDATGTGTPGDATDNGVLANDTDVNSDALSAVLVTGPAHHNGVFSLNANGTFTYTHDGSETISDSFTYKANDGTADGNTVTVSLTVTPVNDNPIANTDSLIRQKHGGAKIHVSQVLSNDTDAESNTLTVTGVVSPTINNATISLDGGWLIYEPPSGFNASDSFTYTISDGQGGTASGTVNVTVGAESNEQTKNILSVTPSGSDMLVRIAGIAGRTYRIETTASLSPPINWSNHPAGPQTAGSNGTVELTDIAPPAPRFYRAVEN